MPLSTGKGGENPLPISTGLYDAKSKTSGIQEAIDALPEAGGQVHLPAGNYDLRCSIRLPSRVRLIGEGAATILRLSKLKAVSLSKNIRKGARSMSLEKPLAIGVGDAVGIGDDHIRGWWGTHAVVEDVQGNVLRLDRPLNRTVSTDRSARAVTLFPAIWAEEATDLAISDLTIEGKGGYSGRWWDFTYAAIHVVSCQRARISGVTVRGWPSDGIGVQRGSDVQVSGCQVHDCRGHGYHPGTGLANSIWTQNIGRNNGGDGLYFCMRVHHSICSDSIFEHNAQNGIGGVGNGVDRHDIISNNVCANNGLCGIDANRGEEQMINGNLLLNNSQKAPGVWPGIRLHDLRRGLVQGNRCVDDQESPTQTQGIVESGSSDENLVSGNLCVTMVDAVKMVGRNSRSEGNLW
ncbi:MAG: right-handed parallel beta-helix repeat-containing protein [bacterium]|nr:right-handed parallel beta-helix repeat-containing protein [bacterium]